jgi:subtilisin family serine protease
VAVAEAASAEAVAALEILNQDAAHYHRVDRLRSLLGASGKGIVVGVYEVGGVPLATHEAFQRRVSVRDGTVKVSDHATHVAGTVGAEPPPEKDMARGMAPAVEMHAYEITQDYLPELENPDSRMSVSVHSYGRPGGWEWEDPRKCLAAEGVLPASNQRGCWIWVGPAATEEDWIFGAYTHSSRDVDRIALASPHRTMFIAAGNDREQNPGGPGWDDWHLHGDVWTNGRHRGDGSDEGFDSLGGDEASAKNVITVGALADAGGRVRADNVKATPFSGFGPTDDGRIKPDVVANGEELTSTWSVASTRRRGLYEPESGTSMAAPVAAGIAALLNELSARERGRVLYSDEMKAVMVHTAVNVSPGPSFSTGWGAIDALAAGRVAAARPGSPQLVRAGASTPTTEYRLQGRGGRGVKVTLAWLDSPGTPVEGLDPPGRMLVDNLDLLLVDPRGNHHYPWKLDLQNRAADAEPCVHLRGEPNSCRPNDRDNVEQVQVDGRAVASGEWILRVTVPPSAAGKSFALVIEGLTERR